MTLSQPVQPEKLAAQTLYPYLEPADQDFIRDVAGRVHLTFQELRQLAEAACDLRMWGETPLLEWWSRTVKSSTFASGQDKKDLLHHLRQYMLELKRQAKHYPEGGLAKPKPPKLSYELKESAKKIMGLCPVASPDTLCCKLRTIDAVENCGFGCSYCTIQSFYGDRIVFDRDFCAKLMALELEPDRFYHLCTGQSSDSLLWGNRYGILEALCDFARKHPNILLEFKTKSKNVAWFLESELPPNIVLSWSLNTPTVIRNEEHFTAGLDQRLEAARRVADRGVRVAFHFHPLVYYDAWQEDYRALAQRVLDNFIPAETLFISFGSVTFIKPVIQAIRRRGGQSKILQMELLRAPKGKYSYPDQLKQEMFSFMYRNFAPWHGQVFFYLCMETPKLWHSTFGFAYPTNDDFEREFARATIPKLLTP